MKKLVLAIIALSLLAVVSLPAADKKWNKVEASELGILGKPFDTPNPYHRIDTVKYKGFTFKENRQCRMPAGYTVFFKTNATEIGISAQFSDVRSGARFRSYMGFDLYVRKDGQWVWSGCNDFPVNWNNDEAVVVMAENMSSEEKECLLYLPLECELNGCQVCVPEGSYVVGLESPFRHRIIFHGSSFTHGTGCVRAGMSYPMQFMRRTGMQVVPLGFSGNCKMQPYFADVLDDIDADAIVLDPFSNPDPTIIRERLVPFIDRLVKSHPGVPVIVQRTIYLERENFCNVTHTDFVERRALSDSMMAVICKQYKDVYYIKPDASLHNGESSTADGIHPNDNGYSLWEASIEKPVLRILRKYGIK